LGKSSHREPRWPRQRGLTRKEQSEFAQTVHVHEVGIIDDRYEHLSVTVDLPASFDEQLFSAGIAPADFDAKGFAEDLQGVGVGVECACNRRGDHAFGVMMKDGLFDDAFAGAGFAHDHTESALLGVDFDGVEDLFLVGEQWGLMVIEGVEFESEV